LRVDCAAVAAVQSFVRQKVVRASFMKYLWQDAWQVPFTASTPSSSSF